MTLRINPEPVDIFWRNPWNYINELKRCGEFNLAWDRGVAAKWKVDVQQYSKIHMGPSGAKWRAYSIGTWHAQEWDSECANGEVRGVYPTFDCSEDRLEELLDYIRRPWGHDKSMYNDSELPKSVRPVKGQANRIFITNIPNTGWVEGRRMIKLLEEVQDQYRDQCEIFIHRLYSYSEIFGRNWKSASVDPREDASKGRIILPNGRAVDPRGKELGDPKRGVDRTYLDMHIKPMGFNYPELGDAKKRCMFNIQSARHASIHWETDGRPTSRPPKNFRPDIKSPTTEVKQATVQKKVLTPVGNPEINTSATNAPCG